MVKALRPELSSYSMTAKPATAAVGSGCCAFGSYVWELTVCVPAIRRGGGGFVIDPPPLSPLPGEGNPPIMKELPGGGGASVVFGGWIFQPPSGGGGFWS